MYCTFTILSFSFPLSVCLTERFFFFLQVTIFLIIIIIFSIAIIIITLSQSLRDHIIYNRLGVFCNIHAMLQEFRPMT